MGLGFFGKKDERHASGSSSDDNVETHHAAKGGSKPGMEYTEDLERIHTMERVGTHAQYYEKDGLRTEGDGLNHDGSKFKVRTGDGLDSRPD